MSVYGDEVIFEVRLRFHWTIIRWRKLSRYSEDFYGRIDKEVTFSYAETFVYHVFLVDLIEIFLNMVSLYMEILILMCSTLKRISRLRRVHRTAKAAPPTTCTHEYAALLVKHWKKVWRSGKQQVLRMTRQMLRIKEGSSGPQCGTTRLTMRSVWVSGSCVSGLQMVPVGDWESDASECVCVVHAR